MRGMFSLHQFVLQRSCTRLVLKEAKYSTPAKLPLGFLIEDQIKYQAKKYPRITRLSPAENDGTNAWSDRPWELARIYAGILP